MPSVTRRSTASRADRRDQIVAQLVTAVERLLEEGESYTELSVERLVKEAGISRSTFYVYFEDKGALLRAMTVDVMEQEIAATRAWLELPSDASFDDIAAALRPIIEVYRPYQALMGAVVDVSTYDAAVREEFNRLITTAVQAIAGHIRSGQKAGHVRANLDPEPTAAWLVWMVERGCYQLIRGADEKAVGRLSDALATLIWNTLYEGAPGRALTARSKARARKG